MLFALKGRHFRAFCRWLKRDYDGLFGGLPDRTRLLRALEAHEVWTRRFMADPSLFSPLIASFENQTIMLTDLGFRDKDCIPANLKLCEKGTWNDRMVVEKVLSMVTVICQLKKIYHRDRNYIFMRFGLLAAMFNILYDLFHDLHPDQSKFKLSIAEFSL